MPRFQLSLYITGPQREAIERVRSLVDPVQRALIPAHVTLCRDDELTGAQLSRLAGILSGDAPIRLGFAEVRSLGSHGIALRCTEGVEAYLRLRGHALGPTVRDAEPHITLAHPRNPRAPGNVQGAVDLVLPLYVAFDRVVLIQQDAPEMAWRVVDAFPLGNVSPLNQALEPTTLAVTNPAEPGFAPAAVVAHL